MNNVEHVHRMTGVRYLLVSSLRSLGTLENTQFISTGTYLETDGLIALGNFS